MENKELLNNILIDLFLFSYLLISSEKKMNQNYKFKSNFESVKWICLIDGALFLSFT